MRFALAAGLALALGAGGCDVMIEAVFDLDDDDRHPAPHSCSSTFEITHPDDDGHARVGHFFADVGGCMSWGLEPVAWENVTTGAFGSGGVWITKWYRPDDDGGGRTEYTHDWEVTVPLIPGPNEILVIGTCEDGEREYEVITLHYVP